MSDIYGCVCKQCRKYKTHIKDGICFECIKELENGLPFNNSNKDLKTIGVYY